MGALDAFAVVEVADGAAVVRLAAREALLPERDLRVSEWSEEYRLLASKTSSEPGPWRNARTPYLVEPMDCLSTGHPAEEIVLQWGTQLGKTEGGNNWLGYVIHQAPAPMMAIQPTLNLAKRFSKHRLSSMIDEMFVLRARIGEKRSRDAANTTLMKDFPGGLLVIAGANSAADLRSMPCKYIFADEIDAYPFDVDGEGDPLALADKRASNFPRRKKLKTSTPTTKGFSRIEQAINQTDLRRYHVPCPQCDERQVLRWKNMRWTSDPEHDPDSAHYVCEHNGCVIEEHHKTAMLAAGAWIPDFPGRGDGKRVGFHLSTLYSPLGWESWASLVRQFLEAKRALDAGDDTKMKTFVNTCLAETWEEQGDQVKVEALQARAERYDLRAVPWGGLVLTLACDVQGNRLEYKIKAWGRFEESWEIDYGVLWGDPAQTGETSVWAELKRVIATPIAHACGRELRVLASAIDSGGHHTHEVYQFCRANRHLNVFAVKGLSQSGRPILGKPTLVDVNTRGDRIKKGVQLWLLGTDTAKSLIYGRLKVTEPGPGFIHFSDQLPGEYYAQLTAERLVTRYVKGRPRLEWIKPGAARNEALDLEVYAIAAAHKLGLNRYKALDWDRLEQQVQPLQPDLLRTPDQQQSESQVQTSARPARRAGRIGSFGR
jgi:phage terminase large subunit GpA-like protein